MKKYHALCLASLLALGSTQTFAQNTGHFYGGIGAGGSRSKIDLDRINAGLVGAGTTTNITHDEHGDAYKVFGGYQFNPYIGLEAGYFNLGEFGVKSTTSPAGTLDGRINLDLVGTLPVNNQLSLLLRLGTHDARARNTFTGTGAVVVANPNPEKREQNQKLGVGFSYKFGQSMSLRGELERYRINDAMGSRADIHVASLSLVFPFGHTQAPAPKMVQREVAPLASTPAPLPAPAHLRPPSVVERVVPQTPPPIAVVAPPLEKPAPERIRVSLNADMMFGFDRADVTPAGKRDLDQFSDGLIGVEYDHVMVEGHTDQIGSPAYNETLSLERADAVKAYLVSRGTIPAHKISTVGKGSTQPMTEADACKGIHTSAAVIACLEPDRRVDLDVSGTQPVKK